MNVTVIGAGLAGCEAALQLARRGIRVRLVEMRPGQMTLAHRTGDAAELVCSNSLKSDEPQNAHGLLKAELRLYGSVLLECAARARVPGGKALVVDRERFSAEVGAALAEAGITVERGEAHELPAGVVVVASGPLTSDPLAESLSRALGAERLFFFDAIAPVVSAGSVDRSVAFAGSRYGAGEDYLNCPLDEAQYRRLVDELVRAELHPMRDFERRMLFEGCLPVEELARRGPETLAFGSMKPVGLRPSSRGHDPGSVDRSGSCPCPHAVVQLRQENAAGTMFNLVGFQTRLRQSEQRRVFRLIPGLARAEFLRYGAMHRNSYLDSPRVLGPTLAARARPGLFVAGQLTGVEGYVESIGAGLVAGANAARLCRGEEPLDWPGETMLGALLAYVGAGPAGGGRFQPMNANFGLLPRAGGRGSERRERQAERALAAARGFAARLRG
ncbi:MAG: methylenetetrahydrofolate--tRNA-(uracil(54)-C(5))-methyltransferase (FADH(2)-oxidizing) TrmFO [bacterium]